MKLGLWETLSPVRKLGLFHPKEEKAPERHHCGLSVLEEGL